MELQPWRIEFKKGWDRHFQDFDKAVQEQILRKFQHMKQPLAGRGLHKTRYLIEEAGQYRIAYEQHEAIRIKAIHFVGTHKQYERWYKQLPEVT